jgi:hypothetical protein
VRVEQILRRWVWAGEKFLFVPQKNKKETNSRGQRFVFLINRMKTNGWVEGGFFICFAKKQRGTILFRGEGDAPGAAGRASGEERRERARIGGRRVAKERSGGVVGYDCGYYNTLCGFL